MTKFNKNFTLLLQKMGYNTFITRKPRNKKPQNVLRKGDTYGKTKNKAESFRGTGICCSGFEM